MREIAYRIYLYPNHDLMQCLEELLRCRYKLAKLVGYESYGHRALKGTMARTPGEYVCAHCDSFSWPDHKYRHEVFLLAITCNVDVLPVAETVMSFLQLLTEKLADR